MIRLCLELIPAFARRLLRPISEQPFVVHPGRDARMHGLALRNEGVIVASRGVIVVARALERLAEPLSSRNIRVIVARPASEKDPAYVAGRILVTDRPEAVWDAPSFDMGVITWASRPKFVDDPEAAAETISRTLTGYDLWRRHHGFLIVLRPNAEPLYADLIA